MGHPVTRTHRSSELVDRVHHQSVKIYPKDKNLRPVNPLRKGGVRLRRSSMSKSEMLDQMGSLVSVDKDKKSVRKGLLSW
mmetsp:Transcript_29002/g.45459  ORF Transcript_29002/g.45459 Transcript_29002/m.45459 type:complete len:80 (-) Transcript_29002:169-408(-)